MPLFLVGLIGALGTVAGNLVGRILIALGIGYVTYTGVDFLIGGLKDLVFANLVSSYPEINAALSMLNIGKAINITFSAIVARNALAGLTSGSITRQVFKS